MRYVLLLFLVAASAVTGQPLSDEAVAKLASAFASREPATLLSTNFSMAEALRIQKAYVRELGKLLGPKSGYKAGLVTKAGQERVGLREPVRGTLLEGMLLPNESTISASYGVRPMVEADVIVTIRSDAINKARTIEEAAAQIDHVVCFIELADSPLRTNQPVNGAVLAAINVGAHSGVLGESRAWRNEPAFVDAFGKMEMLLEDENGKVLASGSTSAMMGHPLNVLLWLVQDLAKSGKALKEGDVVSLGSPLPAVPARAGLRLTLRYHGLPDGPLKAEVIFN